MSCRQGLATQFTVDKSRSIRSSVYIIANPLCISCTCPSAKRFRMHITSADVWRKQMNFLPFYDETQVKGRQTDAQYNLLYVLTSSIFIHCSLVIARPHENFLRNRWQSWSLCSETWGTAPRTWTGRRGSCPSRWAPTAASGTSSASGNWESSSSSRSLRWASENQGNVLPECDSKPTPRTPKWWDIQEGAQNALFN